MTASNMRGIQIKDAAPSARGVRLVFDLKDILAIISDFVPSHRWRCQDVVYTGTVEGEFTMVRLPPREFSGYEFSSFASAISQTIDGTFEALENDSETPWLIIRAVDSSWFEVWSLYGEVLERIKRHFASVRDIPANTG